MLALFVYSEHFTPSTVKPEGTKNSISTKKSGKMVGFRNISVIVQLSPEKMPSVEKYRLYSICESAQSFSLRYISTKATAAAITATMIQKIGLEVMRRIALPINDIISFKSSISDLA